MTGSSRYNHLLTVKFQMANQPFYKSAETYEIKPLPLETYFQFCDRIFKEYGKEITEDAVTFLYYLYSGETAPLQETMNHVFSKVRPSRMADIKSA